MAPKLGLEARMTIGELSRRGWSRCQVARALGVTEGAVRYHLRRRAAGAHDGRADQPHRAAGWQPAIEVWLASRGAEAPLNLAALHVWLVEEHGYAGSVRSLQRYFRVRFPRPARRARRRVETPPGAQGQADWGEFPRVRVGAEEIALHAFHLALSHSRHEAIVWSAREDQVSWLSAHNGSFRRLGGVPAVVRVDNVKTAIVQGAGAWGQINETYRRYAQAVRFHVDACAPYAPEAKGKVERRIRDQRERLDPTKQAWRDLDELQAWTDEGVERSARRRVCPATGTRVWEAWQAERPHLGPLPLLPEPFDVVVTREVSVDCLVAFEGRSYSVPFRLVGQRVEVRGCAGRVQVLAGGQIVAQHPRHTAARLLLDAAHFEGEATDAVLPPLPLGRMGRRVSEIAALAPQKRPIDWYAELAEVAR
jgi:transposase